MDATTQEIDRRKNAHRDGGGTGGGLVQSAIGFVAGFSGAARTTLAIATLALGFEAQGRSVFPNLSDLVDGPTIAAAHLHSPLNTSVVRPS